MIKKRFVHEFQDHSSEGSLSFIDECEPPARIKLEIDAKGNFWFSANREGWLHFAKIAAELGLGDYEDGYHFHMDENFRLSGGSPEFSFEVDNSLTAYERSPAADN